MLSENDCRRSDEPTRFPFGLTPWGVVAGLPGYDPDDRMIRAQGALNRLQVRIGDFFIDLAARRIGRRKAKRAPEPGRALHVTRTV